LRIIYYHETFGNRNRIESGSGKMKNRMKRFYDKVNAKTLKSLEELVITIATVHNIIKTGGEEVIPT
jgi:transposase-like protein